MPETITAFFHETCLEHTPPAGEFEAEWTGRLAVKEPHPDRPERIRNIRHILEHELGEYLDWPTVTPISRAGLEQVHTAAYIDDIRAFCESGGGRLTAETGANEATFAAARHAAGAAVGAAERALEQGPADVPYALVRPSGHHAQPAQADGFCFFNNTAVAAEAALSTDAVERVAIVDWDVHHGNGTQECFYDRDDVLFISLHNEHWSWDPDAHPQTGDAKEHGIDTGEGYNVNVPLPPGTGDIGYEFAFGRLVTPIVADFDPDLLLVSAGQDPGTVDPLGRNVVTKDGFVTLGERVHSLATDHADGRLALIQEGGYQISHLGYATLGVLEGVLGVDTGVTDPFAWLDEDVPSAKRAIDEIASYYSNYWNL